jgi:hypothetical protein
MPRSISMESRPASRSSLTCCVFEACCTTRYRWSDTFELHRYAEVALHHGSAAPGATRSSRLHPRSPGYAARLPRR